MAGAQLDTEWMAAINSRAQKEDRERDGGRGLRIRRGWRQPNEEQFRPGRPLSFTKFYSSSMVLSNLSTYSKLSSIQF